MFSRIKEEIAVVFERDPAARNTWEVITCYPGFHAMLMHRLAHGFWGAGFKWLGRFVSHVARWATGIEIHPGATIGRRFFIDHGMGVVVGETALIGDDVTLYQGVTLGGTSWNKGKRHPTIGSGVVIGTGATVLGNILVGDHVKIGAGSVVLHSVQPHSTVVGVPGRVVRESQEFEPLEHGDLPDPQGQAIDELTKRVAELEAAIKRAIAIVEGSTLLRQHLPDAIAGRSECVYVT